MRKFAAAIAVCLVVGACADSALTTTTIREDRLRPEEVVGTWVPPPNEQGELLGTWFSATTLELRDDDTYDFESTFGGDSGTYRDRKRAGVLRLVTAESRGVCNPPGRSDLSYTLDRHPSDDADRLSVQFGINRCGSRIFPDSLDRVEIRDDEQLVGVWRREITLSLKPEGAYTLVSELGEDRGRFDFDDGNFAMVTEGGDLCAEGDKASGKIGTSINVPVGSLFLSFGDDECWTRRGMSSHFEWIAGP